jgi:hypothetical protein
LCFFIGKLPKKVKTPLKPIFLIGNWNRLNDSEGNKTSFETKINSGKLPNYNRFDFSSIYHVKISKNNNLQGK